MARLLGFRTLSPVRTVIRLFAALLLLSGVTPAAHAAELTFNRAYQGSISGQTFTTTSLLNADAGSIRFADGGNQRAFQNTSGTLYYTVGGVPYSETGVLNSRYPNGNTQMNAVAFSGTGGDRLLVLSGSYAASGSYSGSSNAIVTKLNEYIDATAPDPAQTTLLVNGGTSATVPVGQTATIVVTAKLGSGTAIVGATVSLNASTSGIASVSPATAPTNGSGQASFTIQGSAAGSVNYTASASANGTTTTSAGSVSVTVTGVRSPAQSTASVPAGTVGTATAVIVTVKDSGGNLVTGAASALSATIGGTNAGASVSTITDQGSGTYRFTYTPIAAGTDSVAIKLDNTAINGSPYGSVVTAPTLVFTPAPGALPGGTVGTVYAQTISVTGGTAAYSFTATGLPAGLTINASTGAIGGTPTAAGSYNASVTATDAYGVTGTAAYTIAIAVQPPAAGAVSASVAANSSNNAVTLALSGGTAASVTVATQAGHGTATATGTAITYTPTAGYSGADSFTYTATNASGTSAPATVSITVGAPTLVFTLAPGALPGATAGSSYSQTISVTGGTAPYSFSATGLPAGLTINPSTGEISGTATTAGSATALVTATDAHGATGTASYSILVAVQPPVAGAVSVTVAANSRGNPVTPALSGGTAASVAIAGQPSHGTATASGTTISYAPAAGYSGADSFTYTATNASGTSDPATVSITVTTPALAFTPAPGALPTGTVGTVYNQAITVAGGTAPYSFTATGLPAGLSIDSASGAITGTPGAAGSFTVTITATDLHGATSSAPYTIAIAVQPPVAGTVSATVAASSTNNPVSLAITGGSATSVTVATQPAHGTATASGTAISYSPTAGYSGADSFTYTATNASGTSAPATVSITVGAPTLVFMPAPGALPGAASGTSYTQGITVSGGAAPYSFSATGLPAGLSLDASTGMITGMPGSAGNHSLTITATDAHGATGSAAYTLAVAEQAPIAAPVSLTVAASSTNNPVTLAITGGTATSVATASSPAHGTASVSGTAISYTPTPGYSGADSFTYTATNASGTSASATVSVTVGAPTLAFTPAPGQLPGGTVATTYSQPLSVSGGGAPYSFSATGLPAGLSIDAATGAITGTPSATGSFTATVTAIDAHGATGTASYSFAIAVQQPIAGAVSATVSANSSGNPVAPALSGGAAASLAIASQPSHGTASVSGTAISYTPTAGYSGADSFTYTSTNASGTSAPATASITVAAPTLVFTPAPGVLPGGAVGNGYSQALSVSGGTAPYDFGATGLPAGLAINPATGAITGTPSASGSFTATVTVTDTHGATGTASYNFTIAVQPPVAGAVSATVAANSSGNPVPPALSGGAATSLAIATQPSHGTASASGATISYTPTAGYSGTDSFTYTATNASGTSAPATVSITVGAPTLVFTPSPGALPGGTVGTGWSQAVVVTGGSAPYSFVATGLPAGLAINAATGAITGTPVTPGNYTPSVTATDAHDATGTASYTIAVAAQLPVANPVSVTVAASSSGNRITPGLTGGSAVSIAVATAPTHGTASVSGMTIHYSPTTGYSGADSFTYTATNASGTSAPATASITVAAPTLVFTPAPGTLPAGTVGTPYARAISASGGTAPYSFSATGLPGSLGIDPATGAITGTPTVAGSYAITVTAVDAHGASATAGYSLVVAERAPIANPVSATVAANSTANAVSLDLSGGAVEAVAVASPPAHGTATVSGTAIGYTPTAGYSGTDSFTYTATNASGTSAAATVTITVGAPTLVFTPGSGGLPGATVGTAYSQALSVSGGTAPYGFTATGLPAGLSIDAATGAISGTPSTAGSFIVTVTATDAHGAASAASYTIAVEARAPVAVDSTSATVPANTRTEAGQNVGINLSSLVSGQYDDIRIVTQPRHGSVTISRTLAMRGGGGALAMAIAFGTVPGQVVAIYTPEANYQGADSFQFVAVGPGGLSSPATVAIEVVGRAPTARAQVASTIDGQPVSVELTTGATDGPFTGAAILSVTPADQASATIVQADATDAHTFRLTVTPKARFGGAIVINYTLTNAFGTSAPATVTVNVTRRPDPSADPVVQAVSEAQAESALRFSHAQVANFMRRAEGLHGECTGSNNGLRLNSTDARSYRREDDGQNDLAALRGTADRDPADQQPDPARRTSRDRCASAISAWTGGTVDIGTRDAVTGRAKISATTAGVSAGIDARVARNLTLGIGGGLGRDSSRIADGTAHVIGNATVLALYGSFTPVPGLFVDGMVSHGWLDFDVRRLDATTGLTGASRRDGQFTTAALSAGIERVSGPLQWSVYGRGEYLAGTLAAYREQGAGIYDLRFDRRDLRSTSATLGFRTAYRRPVSFGVFSATLRGEWQHEFTDGGSQGVDYADIGGTAMYSLHGQGWSRDQFTLNPGFELTLPSDWDFALNLGLRATKGERALTSGVQIRRNF